MKATTQLRKIILLTEGQTNPSDAKTATSLLRYKPEEVIGILDKNLVGKNIQDYLGVGYGIPIISRIQDADNPDTLLIGVAPTGGRLPIEWRDYIKEAIQLGINIVSGLHQFISDDSEFSQLATKTGSTIYDVRKNNENDTATLKGMNDTCLRIHAVGQDCNIGKMITCIEINNYLKESGKDSKFVATGQTGIMIEGDGCPIDCVVSDFVNGSAEKLVLKNQHHDIIIVEGQGSIAHPIYSAVTCGLLHGIRPHGLILCYEANRPYTRHTENHPLPSLSKLKEALEIMSNFINPCQVIAISMNSKNLSAEEAEIEKLKITEEFNLPVCDVIRHGPQEISNAIIDFQESLFANKTLTKKAI